MGMGYGYMGYGYKRNGACLQLNSSAYALRYVGEKGPEQLDVEKRQFL